MNKTHDYSNREWGHNYQIISNEDGGHKLSMSGWGRGINSGDYIIIKNGVDTTRYIFDKISYYNDPVDMWSGDLTFAPRASVIYKG
tara:strand:- start:201 stop:458 length:258 start_codon:yes stop_codon:yes gene_type:complete